jgi:hypothetical protein
MVTLQATGCPVNIKKTRDLTEYLVGYRLQCQVLPPHLADEACSNYNYTKYFVGYRMNAG